MQNKEHTQIDEWITCYLSGELDEQSFAKLKQWTFASEANRAHVRRQVEIWFSTGVADDTYFDKEKAFELFRRRVNAAEQRKRKVYNIFEKTWLRVAAVILILILPLIGYWQGQKTLKQTFADISVEAPMGARTKLYLPDGTLVWLNAGSKIVYSQGFGVDDRRLKMEGEGYFEVVRNEQIPFEVNTKELNLRVLGTKFNICNYPEDKVVTVNLLEGKVALHNEVKSMPELYLDPDEKVVMDKMTGEMVKSHCKAIHSSDWINDELFFDEDLLDDIVKRLERSYDVKIEVADSLRNRRFYGSFKVQGNTIEDVLSIMSSTNQMRYRYENGKYILY